MLSVAIVEDNNAAATLLYDYVERYGEETGKAFSVKIFSDAVSFLNNYRTDYEIIFMDIEMPMLNGMDAAKKIRAIDPVVSIIFVTNMAEYAVDGYAVNAFDFMLKPVNYLSFFTLLDRITTKIESEQSFGNVVLQTNKRLQKIKIKDISYIEISGHNIIYHTDNGDISDYGILKEVEKNLPKDSFSRCNACYLVNLARVTYVEGYNLFLGKQKLQISQAKKQDFMRALTEYLGEKL